jgi:hypothetical protein
MNIEEYARCINSLEATAAHFGNPIPGKFYYLSGWPALGKQPILVLFIRWEMNPKREPAAVFLNGESIQKVDVFSGYIMDGCFDLKLYEELDLGEGAG